MTLHPLHLSSARIKRVHQTDPVLLLVGCLCDSPEPVLTLKDLQTDPICHVARKVLFYVQWHYKGSEQEGTRRKGERYLPTSQFPKLEGSPFGPWPCCSLCNFPPYMRKTFLDIRMVSGNKSLFLSYHRLPPNSLEKTPVCSSSLCPKLYCIQVISIVHFRRTFLGAH